MLRSVFNFFASLFFRLLFYSKHLFNSQKSLYLFDVDNTIANTHPTLLKSYPSENERLLSISPFTRMVNLCNAIQRSPSRKLVFITVRTYKQWSITHIWLQKHGIDVTLTDIIIVDSPAQKAAFIQDIVPRQKPVVFIDDFSYNHEHGEVKYYDNEIRLISGLSSLRYIGYKSIKKFQSKK